MKTGLLSLHLLRYELCIRLQLIGVLLVLLVLVAKTATNTENHVQGICCGLKIQPRSSPTRLIDDRWVQILASVH